jgi:hypothetical protein
MHSQKPEVICAWTILDRHTGTRTAPSNTQLQISNVDGGDGEVILDYGRCEGGTPIFVVNNAVPSDGEHDVPFRVVYSETREGIDHDTGKHSCIATQSMNLVSNNCHGR